ncbi:hypothetical protein Tco_1252497 [Tanacetum coccineum]
MHNNTMAAESRDRPPMLAKGRYAQWQSRFLRYIDTRPNGDALWKCILQGPYIPSTDTIPAEPATNDSLEVPGQTAVKTLLNMSPENKEHYQSKKEAIHLLLTGIRDEIYSTVDACKIAYDMWIAIERLQHADHHRVVKKSKSKVLKSISANKKEPSKSWGSKVSDVPSSSLDEYRSSKFLFGMESGCSKHMTEDRSQLTNFVNKFLGTVKFGNDHVAKILGYGDYQIRNVMIIRIVLLRGKYLDTTYSFGQFFEFETEVLFDNTSLLHSKYWKVLIYLTGSSRKQSVYSVSHDI